MTSPINLFQASPAPVQQPTFDLNKLTEAYKQHRNTDWSIPEAFLCLLISAAGADGVVSVEEMQEIYALTGRSRALKTLSADQLAQANATINQRLATRSNGVEEACQALPGDMRLPVFAHCVDIILADGELAQVEADFLNKLVTSLELPPADAQRVMEVMLIKNRF